MSGEIGIRTALLIWKMSNVTNKALQPVFINDGNHRCNEIMVKQQGPYALRTKWRTTTVISCSLSTKSIIARWHWPPLWLQHHFLSLAHYSTCKHNTKPSIFTQNLVYFLSPLSSHFSLLFSPQVLKAHQLSLYLSVLHADSPLVTDQRVRVCKCFKSYGNTLYAAIHS